MDLIVRAAAMIVVVGVAFSPASRAADPHAPPSAEAALAAMSVYRAGSWHFEGVLDTAPGARFLVSLSGSGGGAIVGEALLLTADRRLLAASPVTGRVDATGCHVSFDLAGERQQLDGICRPELLAGELTRTPASPGLLTRILAWWGGRDVHGEAWLAPARAV